MENRTYRMYGMVPYNISEIQKGIQFGHAVQEYNNFVKDLSFKYLENRELPKNEFSILNSFEKWSLEDKTFIILNGGTTNNNPDRLGTLNIHMNVLLENGVKCVPFYEPDLGDQLSAFVFLIDDRVFDKKTWKDYEGALYEDGTPEEHCFYEWKMNFSNSETEADTIVFLREYLRNLKLA